MGIHRLVQDRHLVDAENLHGFLEQKLPRFSWTKPPWFWVLLSPPRQFEVRDWIKLMLSPTQCCGGVRCLPPLLSALRGLVASMTSMSSKQDTISSKVSLRWQLFEQNCARQCFGMLSKKAFFKIVWDMSLEVQNSDFWPSSRSSANVNWLWFKKVQKELC